ncbi:hypothetical protein [Amycolatopsis sp. cmx-11-51]|uniref:hypothetical protein n=1 Tax=Amycolatopsis sp. cmx-11-51 TaxID=2785797 RepID=UPI0039E6D447
MDVEPPQHARYTDYRRALARVADADEVVLVAEVLADPDRVMAEAAISGHLDDRTITLNAPRATEDLLAATDWLQRKACECSTSPETLAVLAVLAGNGRTKRVRNAASLKLSRRRR